MADKFQEGPNVSPITGKFVLIRGFLEVFGQMAIFKTYNLCVENLFSVAIRDKEGQIKGWLKKEDVCLFSKFKTENIRVKAVSSERKNCQKVTVLIEVEDAKMVAKIEELLKPHYKYTVYEINPWK